MGIRKQALLLIREILDGTVIGESISNTDSGDILGPGTEYNPGSGRLIHAVNKIVDPETWNRNNFPVICIMPGVLNVVTGLYGHYMDSTNRIAIFGFVKKEPHEELILTCEDVLDTIMHKLTDWESCNKFAEKDFSIIEIGPVLNETYSESTETGDIGYISIQLTIQYVEN
jgi:hypothetical protein